jgi:hypothetical protein
MTKQFRYSRLSHFHSIFLFLSIVGLGGCGHLHNPQNAEIATRAVTKFSALSIENLIADAEANQEALFAAELKMVESFIEQDRQATLTLLAVDEGAISDVWLEAEFKTRLEVLGFTVKPESDLLRQLSDLRKINAAIKRERRNAANSRAELSDELIGFNPPACDALVEFDDLLKAAKDEIKNLYKDVDEESAKEYFNKYQRHCKEASDEESNLNGLFPKGEIASARARVDQANKELADAEKNQREATDLLEEAWQELKSVQNDKNTEPPSKVIGETVGKIQKLVGNGRELTGTFAELAVVDRQLEVVDEFLLAVAKGTADEDANRSERRLVLAVAALPGLADRASELSRSLNRTPTTALVMIKQSLAARRAQVERRKERLLREKAIYEQRLEALLTEAAIYAEVWESVVDAKENAKDGIDPFKKSMGNVTASSVGARSAESVKRAVARQVYAESESRRVRFDTEYRLASLDHSAVLSGSRAAIGEWQAMLGPLIEQQQRFHAGGVKPVELAELIAQLMQAAGLFAIAGAVH